MKKLLISTMTVVATVSTSMAGTTIINDDFSASSLTKGSITRSSTGWVASGSSAFTYGTGNTWMYNTNNAGGNVSDGAMATIVPLGALGLTNENVLDVNFTFNSWNGTTGDNIYVHLWGLVDVSSTPTSGIANLGAQNGAMWVDALANGFDAYNLGTGSQMTIGADGVGGGAAIQLLNQDTGDSLISNAVDFNTTIDLSGHTLNTVADYDYLVMAFARDPEIGIGNGLAIHDVELNAVPEPSSLALLGLGGLALTLRRRK